MTASPLAVVSGGTRGLGREISLTLGAAGYRVIAIFRSNEAAAEELLREFSSRGIEGECRRLDLSMNDFPESSLPECGELIIVNNACGAFVPTPVHLIAPDEFKRLHETIVMPACRLTLPLIRRLVIAKRSTVVSLLTRAIASPLPRGFAAYVSAKGALWGFTRALAAELSGRGVRVFSVSPGRMDTDLTRDWPPGPSPPLSPGEIARRIQELCFDEKTKGEGEDYSLE